LYVKKKRVLERLKIILSVKDEESSFGS
jgi:hypothetical protein